VPGRRGRGDRTPAHAAEGAIVLSRFSGDRQLSNAPTRSW
jgi:hypothetical protein